MLKFWNQQPPAFSLDINTLLSLNAHLFPMWLALDIGNSAIKGGFFEGGMLAHTFGIPHEGVLPDEASTMLTRFSISGAGIASVVPALTEPVRAALVQRANVQAQVIHASMPLPFQMGYRTPDTLGADRLAATAAAFYRFHQSDERPRAVIVVDAGSAVTYEVLDRNGTYRGGAIAPGPRLLRDALSRGTAQLPAVATEPPIYPIGTSTTEALQSGIIWGFVDAVSGMLRRLEAALGEVPYVVATGGWAPLLAAQVPAIQRVESHLVLHGVYLLANTSSH